MAISLLDGNKLENYLQDKTLASRSCAEKRKKAIDDAFDLGFKKLQENGRSGRIQETVFSTVALEVFKTYSGQQVNADLIARTIRDTATRMAGNDPKQLAALSVSGGLTSSNWASTIQYVLEQIIPMANGTSETLKMCPIVSVPQPNIYIENWNAYGGQTNEYSSGEYPKTVNSVSRYATYFEPGQYRENIEIMEDDMNFYRQSGTFDVIGLERLLQMNTKKMTVRAFNRMINLIVTAFVSGSYTFRGKAIQFGLNSDNRVLPLGSNYWLTNPSGENYVVNQSADPLQDFLYWSYTGAKVFRRLRPALVGSFMDPITVMGAVANNNFKNFANLAFANEKIYGGGKDYEMNRVLSFVLSGYDLPVEVISDGWLTDEQGDLNSFKYFWPAGYIGFRVNATPYGGATLGEFTITNAIQNGTAPNNPAPGMFFQMEDCTVAGSRGGPGRPFYNMVLGYNGGPKINRPQDVLSAQVIASIPTSGFGKKVAPVPAPTPIASSDEE